MADIALGAIRPLLGLIQKEAQQLRGVRNDVQFIKEEMESMDAFLLNLMETKELAGGNRQARAWAAQVMELAYDSTNCVLDYAESGRARTRGRRGVRLLLGRLRRLVWLPKRYLARRRIAAKLRKLKVRAREIGERQRRYAVAAPPLPRAHAGVAVETEHQADGLGGYDPGWPIHPETDAHRRAIIAGPDLLTEGTKEVIGWLKEEEIAAEEQQWRPRVIAILSQDGHDEAIALAKQVHHVMSSGAGVAFDIIKLITIQRPVRDDFMLEVRRQLLPDHPFVGNEEHLEVPPPLKWKKVLVVISSLEYLEEWDKIKMDLDSFECSPGSAIVLTTKVKELAQHCSPTRTRVHSLVDFHLEKAASLTRANAFSKTEDELRQSILKNILKRCYPNAYCMSTFLHALHRNPHRTEDQLKKLYESLDPRRYPPIEQIKHMMKFCYEGLPEAYKNCLSYTAMLTKGKYRIQTASLLRRWVAEELIAKKDRWSALDEAQRCFDALSSQKLLFSCDVDGVGKIKSCNVAPLVRTILKETKSDGDFIVNGSSKLPPALALHFSSRNGIQLHQFSMGSNSRLERLDGMVKLMKSLHSSSSFRLLRVLDLEGYKGFKKRHLRNICKIYQLRYLSLRNTDITQLPGELDQLLHLETIDIRGTRVRVFNAVLPMLKHLLAGRIKSTNQGGTSKYRESLCTVRLTRNIALMENLEILSHVKVSNGAKELINVGEKLPKLRKLGVVLSGKKANLEFLFHEIRKFNSLSSLSVRVEPQVNQDMADAAVMTLPSFFESLHICGIVGWSPSSIQELHQLTRLTLCKTFLKADALSTLGTLQGLLCLRLRYHSFEEATIIFEAAKFQALMDLVIEDENLRSIMFASGTAPRLSKIAWSFDRMNFLLGVQNLVSLQRLELNQGRCDPNGLQNLRQDIAAHHNRVHFRLGPPEDRPGSGAATATTH
ncbi:hypothetical protein ACP4OV_002019 [Aristida adscensionis]